MGSMAVLIGQYRELGTLSAALGLQKSSETWEV